MAEKLHIAASDPQSIANAKQAEIDGDIESAAAFYEDAIKDEKAGEFPFDRLMIIYRKLKQYKKELQVINKGIRLFEARHKKHQPKSASKKQVTALSNAFMKTSGLHDKKGESLYKPQPIARWLQRKSVIEKKIKSK